MVIDISKIIERYSEKFSYQNSLIASQIVSEQLGHNVVKEEFWKGQKVMVGISFQILTETLQELEKEEKDGQKQS